MILIFINFNVPYFVNLYTSYPYVYWYEYLEHESMRALNVLAQPRIPENSSDKNWSLRKKARHLQERMPEVFILR